MRKTISALLLVLNILPLYAQEIKGDTLEKIKAIFKNWSAKNSPGAVLAISRNGKLIYNSAWGMADIENQIPNTTSTNFDAASISKQFTAAGILLLEAQGKLSLDDDIRKYLPELPVLTTPVRVRHLVYHTSGLHELTAITLTGWERGTGTFGNERILNLLARQKELVHAPGDEHNYVNSNYNLLAVIIERVSGMQFNEFFRKNIFDRLGMRNTYWNNFIGNSAIACGYINSSGGFKKTNPTIRVYGNGGLMTTASDLVKWNNGYLSGQLLGSKFLQRQLQQGILNNGVTIPYAAGLIIWTYKGHKTITHDGLGSGYTSFTESFPDLGLSFVLMSNVASLDPGSTCRQVEDLFITPKVPEATSKEAQLVKLSAGPLQRYEGWYKNTRTNAGILLTLRGSVLLSDNGDTLYPISPKRFKLRRNVIEFADSMRSNAKLITNIPYADTILFQPVLPPDKNIKLPDVYKGEFYSDELESKVILISSDDTLTLQLPGGKTYKLKPMYKDGFTSEPSIISSSPTYIYFERDNNGILKVMRISIYRSRNILFEKTK